MEEFATREELHACKAHVEEKMSNHVTKFDQLCAAVDRIEKHTQTTKEIVEVWDNTKAVLAGVASMSSFISRTWKFWVLLPAIIFFFNHGRWPSEWFIGK